MPGSSVHVFQFSGGFRCAFESRSGPGFAFDLRLPLGSAHDPVGREGSAAVLEEWLFKGAAGRDARQLQDAFDDLGVRRGGGVGPEATRLSVSGLLEDLPAALSLVADVLLRPALPEAEVPVLLDLARQDLEALRDSPSDLLGVQARAHTFPRREADGGAGYGHPATGTLEGLANVTPASLREHYGRRYGQAGSVLGLVADLSAGEAQALVERTFAAWPVGEYTVIPVHFQGGLRRHFDDPEAEQTHLQLTALGVAPTHPDWLAWQLALTALSGGSSSRLFQAVREERGLAYAVGASALVLAGQGFLSVYAGSTPGRLPETLDVICAELRRLPGGLGEAEFRRAHAGLSASIVFGGESARSRAVALTRDLTLFGRVRDLGDLRRELDALTLTDVNRFLHDYQPMQNASLFTLGQAVPA
ncbi:insulinase family protein [Deinococcus cavernae]|uniref:Insulinase family protein n=1 Tax=Deinococcus cavernae TaxID=2320857 RepID=A0A418VCM2_9DEIO|nr:pitrilysin family protein [Deinococcus cavernae]RJF73759.1 insulinase family protein [Deinococcus cavernae]